jgi:hypothetical protein
MGVRSHDVTEEEEVDSKYACSSTLTAHQSLFSLKLNLGGHFDVLLSCFDPKFSLFRFRENSRVRNV